MKRLLLPWNSRLLTISSDQTECDFPAAWLGRSIAGNPLSQVGVATGSSGVGTVSAIGATQITRQDLERRPTPMHCVTLADLAATLSQHGPSLLELRPLIPTETLLRYWTASRSRQELWHRAMARYRDAKHEGHYGRLAEWWSEHVVVLEEVLVSELLTRVVAAIGAETINTNHRELHDSHDSLAAVTHGVFMSQIEASNRVAQIILESSGARIQDTVRLNRLRYGVERWADWLIGRVSVDRDRSFQYSIDVERARTFCEEVRENAGCSHPDTTTWLMNAAMREMLVRRTSEYCALGQANHEVASAALALFRPELFDDYGVPKSVWLHRLQKDAAKLKPFDFAGATFHGS